MLNHEDLVIINYKFFIMKKIKILKNSRFIRINEMAQFLGGDSINTLSCNQKDIYYSCNSDHYVTCGPAMTYKVEPCYTFISCGAIGNGGYASCVSDKLTCSNKFSCGSIFS